MIWVIFIQLVPDAVIFKDKKLPLANQVDAILSKSNGQNFKKLKKKKGSKEGSSSSDLMRADELEIKALMHSLNNVEGLNNSLELVLFCKVLFENEDCRKNFKACRTNVAKLEYVQGEHQRYLGNLELATHLHSD